MIEIRKAEFEDLEEILMLQYLAFETRAIEAGTRDIPPLRQTLDEVKDEFQKGLFLKAVDGNRIIGSVRAREENGTVYIGKLIVHPEYRRNGYGTALLREMEKCYPGRRFELFTGSDDADNLRLYDRNGYSEFCRREVNPYLTFVYLEKVPEIS